MRNNKYLWAIGVLFLISACGIQDSNTNNLSELEEEVMAIHDSIMPDMPKIHYKKEALTDWSEAEDFKNIDTTLQSDIKYTIRSLKIAEDAMWDWMSDYADESEKMQSAEDSLKTEFLLRQKYEIIKVRDLMLSSISSADSLLNSKEQ